jgi:hypothetical protein
MDFCIRDDDDDDKITENDCKTAHETSLGCDLTISNQVPPVQQLLQMDDLSDASSSYTIRHQNALMLELSILETVLRRNSDAHAKTKYFRHSTCTLRRLLNPPYSIPTLFAEFNYMMEQLDAKIQRLRKKKNKGNHTKDLDPEIFLEMEAFFDDAADGSSATVFSRATSGITECRQRIEATYRYCLQEILRGFFLPLITIMAACWARIYTFCIRLQSFILQTYAKHCCQLSNILSQSMNSTTTKEASTQNLHFSERIYFLKGQCMQILSNLPNESAFHTSDNARSPSTTNLKRMDRMEQALRHLGLQFPKTKIAPADNPNPGPNSTECSAQRKYQTPLEAKDVYGSTTESLDLDLDNGIRVKGDKGERLFNQLRIPHDIDPDDAMVSAFRASAPTTEEFKASLVVSERIDQNDSLLQQYQNKTKKKRTSETEKSAKAKKKKKDPDFFDQLFK